MKFEAEKREPRVPTTLTRISNGKPAVSDTLKNQQVVKCPRCERTYRLGYSDSEWHRLKDWLGLAETAFGKTMIASMRPQLFR